MKTRIISAILLTVIFLQGCLVKSLHPFYTEQDIVFKKELTGTWTDKDSSIWIIQQHMRFNGLFKSDKPDPSYNISFTDQKGSSKFVAHLFQLEGQLYLDFYPSEISSGNDLAEFHLVATHSLARVDLAAGKITIRWYNEAWLADLFNKNRIRISHERVPYEPDQYDPQSMQVILTAPTDELQKFIKKYGNDPEAFKKKTSDPDQDYTFVLTRKPDHE